MILPKPYHFNYPVSNSKPGNNSAYSGIICIFGTHEPHNLIDAVIQKKLNQNQSFDIDSLKVAVLENGNEVDLIQLDYALEDSDISEFHESYEGKKYWYSRTIEKMFAEKIIDVRREIRGEISHHRSAFALLAQFSYDIPPSG